LTTSFKGIRWTSSRSSRLVVVVVGVSYMCVYLDDPHWGPCGYCLLDRRKKTMTVISSRRRIKGRNGIRESLGEAPSFPIHQRPRSRECVFLFLILWQ
jgi:hypothetical protein